MNTQFRYGFHWRKEQGKQTFGLGITLERRLEERSSSTASENPVPKWEKNVNNKKLVMSVLRKLIVKETSEPSDSGAKKIFAHLFYKCFEILHYCCRNMPTERHHKHLYVSHAHEMQQWVLNPASLQYCTPANQE